MPKQNKETRSFPRGLISGASPYAGPHARKLDNCWIANDDLGAIEPMPGFAKVSSDTIPNAMDDAKAVAVGIDETAYTVKLYEMANSPTDSSVYEIGASTITSRKAALTLNAITTAAQIDNKLVFVNGQDAPFQINLATDAVTDVGAGVTRPDVTVGAGVITALNAAGKGSVKGVVRYWISKMTTTTEGPLSATFGEIDCAGGNSVDITFADETEYHDTSFRIYRTLEDGQHPYLVAQFDVGSSGSTYTYTDNIPDADLVIIPYLHGDAPPSDLICIVNQFNRLWGLTKAGRLYWSDVTNHESWWTASNGNWADIFKGDGDQGTALVRAPDGLYVFKKSHLYHVYTQNLDQIQVTPITLAGAEQRSLGTLSQRSVVVSRHGIFFFHDSNVFVLNGFEARPIADAISENLNSVLIALGYSEANSHLWVSAGTNSYLFSTRSRRWIGKYLFSFAAFAEAPTGTGTAFYGAGGSGSTDQLKSLHTLYSGTNDGNGDAIAVEFESSVYTGRDPTTDKIFLGVDALIDRETVDADITVKGIFDSDTTNTISATVPLDESGSTQERIRRRVNLGFRGRELGVSVSSTAATPQWKLYALTCRWHEFDSSSRRA